MSNWNYNSSINTKNKKLIELFKKASFHYEELRTRKVFNWATNKEEIKTVDDGYDAIDLAVLFGIKNTHYRQEGDIPLTYEEALNLCEIIDVSYSAKYSLCGRSNNGILQTIRGTEWEKEYRIQRCEMHEENGTLELSGGVAIDVELCEVLTKLYPDTEMEAEQYLDYDDEGYMWSYENTIFSVKNGKRKEKEHSYEKGEYSDD